MTAQADSLAAAGALRSLEPAVHGPGGLCAAANVDAARLEGYVRAAVAEFVPGLARQPVVPGSLQIFDFSERKQSNRAATLVDADHFHRRGSAGGGGRPQVRAAAAPRSGSPSPPHSGAPPPPRRCS